jgi:hypothetical protein
LKCPGTINHVTKTVCLTKISDNFFIRNID